ncbi:unnamed protein product [Heligmosomoides polygyrus]|uniref:BTB domain-containing protein n=1 Tax=Heligmosomoides polygyrus TaxID=6339 RepID=A0A183G1A0_HELPZ|nr:unnamed protein product [Heligmosomoides polygyrus]
MVFLGAVRIDVQLEEGPMASVAFHIAKGEEDEILLGTNALPSLGVQLSLVKDSPKRSAEPVGRDDVTSDPEFASHCGHLQYECIDDCFGKLRLCDIEGIEFPGALAKKPFENVWSAWRISSIFIRNDIDVATKMKLHKEFKVYLDTDALARVLKAAYNSCVEWTSFICSTESIARHAPIDAYAVNRPYEIALRQVKETVAEVSRRKRPTKDGPVRFAAPKSARMLEKDGDKIGIRARVIVTFRQLSEVLVECPSESG